VTELWIEGGGKKYGGEKQNGFTTREAKEQVGKKETETVRPMAKEKEIRRKIFHRRPAKKS